jgi:hypothetical protein
VLVSVLFASKHCPELSMLAMTCTAEKWYSRFEKWPIAACTILIKSTGSAASHDEHENRCGPAALTILSYLIWVRRGTRT